MENNEKKCVFSIAFMLFKAYNYKHNEVCKRSCRLCWATFLLNVEAFVSQVKL